MKDECAWVILKSQGTNLYLVSEGGHRLGYSDMGMETLYKEAEKHQVNLCLIESNFGDGMFTQLFSSYMSAHTKDNGYSCSLEEVRSSKQKELRIIDTLEPLFNQHRIIVDRKVIDKDYQETQELTGVLENGCAYSLFYQLTHITKDRGSLNHDDRADAFAGCAARFIEIMNADQDTLIQNNKMADVEADAAIFLGETAESVFDLVALGGDTRKILDKLGAGGIGARQKQWVDTGG